MKLADYKRIVLEVIADIYDIHWNDNDALSIKLRNNFLKQVLLNWSVSYTYTYNTNLSTKEAWMHLYHIFNNSNHNYGNDYVVLSDRAIPLVIKTLHQVYGNHPEYVSSHGYFAELEYNSLHTINAERDNADKLNFVQNKVATLYATYNDIPHTFKIHDGNKPYQIANNILKTIVKREFNYTLDCWLTLAYCLEHHREICDAHINTMYSLH